MSALERDCTQAVALATSAALPSSISSFISSMFDSAS